MVERVWKRAARTSAHETTGGSTISGSGQVPAELPDYFKAHFENTSDVIYSYDCDFRLQYVSPSVTRVLGYTPDEIIGKTFPELGVLAPESLAGAVSDAVKLLAGHSVDREEYVFITKGGERRIGEVTGTKLIEEGKVKSIVSVARDVTERRRVEDNLRRSEEIHRALFQQSLLGIFTFDTELMVTDCNDRILEKLGIPREEVVGFDLGDLSDGSFLPTIRNVFGGEVGTYKGPFSTALENRRWELFLLATPLRDTAGAVIGGIVAIEDITDQRNAQRELKRYSEQLEELVKERTQQLESTVNNLTALNQELEAFSFSVSHDLRVPLRAMSGLSQMLLEQRGEQLDEEGRRQMGLIVESTERMGALIEDLLGLSRAGRHDMSWTLIDMQHLVSDVIEELRVNATGRDLSFDLDRLPPAAGDRVLVRQVLTNLLENSIKFTRDAAPAVIEIGGSAGDDQNTYFVKDNGAGFDMAYSEKLFRVFQRLHSAEEFEGTGVGLALAQRIVHRHGGRVWARGLVGEGATFYFTLPAAAD
ncbi:MAG: PAS domain-containing sensor histidine kinase [Candidatus Geothermincolia bacterium]